MDRSEVVITFYCSYFSGNCKIIGIHSIDPKFFRPKEAKLHPNCGCGIPALSGRVGGYHRVKCLTPAGDITEKVPRGMKEL